MSKIELVPYWNNDLYRLERLITEARELEEKIKKGKNFISEVEEGEIKDFPNDQFKLIKKQMNYMDNYLEVLKQRIEILFKSIEV